MRAEIEVFVDMVNGKLADGSKKPPVVKVAYARAFAVLFENKRSGGYISLANGDVYNCSKSGGIGIRRGNVSTAIGRENALAYVDSLGRIA